MADTPERILTAEAVVRQVAFTADGASLMGVCQDGQVRFWDAQTGTLQRTIPWSKDDLRGLTLSPDRKLLAASGPEKVIKVWELKSGEMRHRLPALSVAPGELAISPDGKTLASNAEAENSIRLWDLATGTQRQVLPDGLGNSGLLFSPDSSLLVGANTDTVIRVWHTGTGKQVAAIEELPVAMFALVFSPDGRFFGAAGADRTIHVFETGGWKKVAALNGQPEMITALALAPQGRVLVAGGFDDVTVKNPVKVLVWDVPSRSVLRTLPARHRVQSVAISPDARWVAVADAEKTVHIWAAAPKA